MKRQQTNTQTTKRINNYKRAAEPKLITHKHKQMPIHLIAVYTFRQIRLNHFAVEYTRSRLFSAPSEIS